MLFFARVRDRRLLSVIEFYAQDIRALEELGYEVTVENRLARALLRRPDACFAWWWHTSLPLVAACRLRRIPVVVTGATDLHNPVRSPFARAVKRVLLPITARMATGSLTISEYEMEGLRRVTQARAAVVPLGVDVDYYRPGPKSEHPSAAIVAHMYPQSIRRKGVDTAIRATALIRRSVPDFRLSVIGRISDDGREELDRLRARCDFSGVDMRGELSAEEKREVLASAWVYLQPSLYEGFALAMVEAMACGTVPVASDRGALPEVMADAGHLMTNLDPETVAGSVLAIVADPERRRLLESLAVERARHFSRPQRVERLRQLFVEWGVR